MPSVIAEQHRRGDRESGCAGEQDRDEGWKSLQGKRCENDTQVALFMWKKYTTCWGRRLCEPRSEAFGELSEKAVRRMMGVVKDMDSWGLRVAVVHPAHRTFRTVEVGRWRLQRKEGRLNL